MRAQRPGLRADVRTVTQPLPDALLAFADGGLGRGNHLLDQDQVVSMPGQNTRTLTKRTERCAVARREPDGGHAAQHLSNIEMASRRLSPPYGSM